MLQGAMSEIAHVCPDDGPHIYDSSLYSTILPMIAVTTIFRNRDSVHFWVELQVNGTFDAVVIPLLTINFNGGDFAG